jgi:hypothetical protein
MICRTCSSQELSGPRPESSCGDSGPVSIAMVTPVVARGLRSKCFCSALQRSLSLRCCEIGKRGDTPLFADIVILASSSLRKNWLCYSLFRSSIASVNLWCNCSRSGVGRRFDMRSVRRGHRPAATVVNGEAHAATPGGRRAPTTPMPSPQTPTPACETAPWPA